MSHFDYDDGLDDPADGWDDDTATDRAYEEATGK